LRRNAIRALGDDAAAQKLFFGAGVVADKAPATRLAALVKLAEFPTSPESPDARAPARRRFRSVQSDEWFNEAARLLAKKHKTRVLRRRPEPPA
jgi:hypothetical protein